MRVNVANPSGQQKCPHSPVARETAVVPMENGGITAGDDLQTKIEAIYHPKERDEPTAEVSVSQVIASLVFILIAYTFSWLLRPHSSQFK